MRRSILALIFAAFATVASAQQYMPLPPGTVMGNVTGQTNPGSAVTMPQLAAALAPFAGVSQPALPSGTIWIGSVGNIATSQTISGNCTLSVLGVLSCAPPVGNITGLGTGVATALGVNVGTAGSPVVNGGALGTPSSGTGTNLTGVPISTGVSGLGTGIATALGVNVGTAGSAVVNGGALGTPSSGTLTSATGLPISTGVAGLGTNVATALAINVGTTLGIARTVATGTSALGTGAISSATCASVVTTAATNTATTDVVTASFNGDPTAVTGYIPLTSGMLTIIVYPTANNVNFKVCNNTASSITPGAITLNWRVDR